MRGNLSLCLENDKMPPAPLVENIRLIEPILDCQIQKGWNRAGFFFGGGASASFYTLLMKEDSQQKFFFFVCNDGERP